MATGSAFAAIGDGGTPGLSTVEAASGSCASRIGPVWKLGAGDSGSVGTVERASMATVPWLGSRAGSGLNSWRRSMKFGISETATDLVAGAETGKCPACNSLGRFDSQLAWSAVSCLGVALSLACPSSEAEANVAVPVAGVFAVVAHAVEPAGATACLSTSLACTGPAGAAEAEVPADASTLAWHAGRGGVACSGVGLLLGRPDTAPCPPACCEARSRPVFTSGWTIAS